ncbi:malate:quinone oxidoreductase [Runella slithyformis]|uniref:malate:quinone oxidoreductase n=1 Tax=Runella slithyformis TaxID=106 RepID=UPI0021CEF7B5|nr:malate:quinone oxidoreductase [Runella slithyformis]
MLKFLQKCFKDQMNSTTRRTKLKEMIPSSGKHLTTGPELTRHIRTRTHSVLQLTPIPTH